MLFYAHLTEGEASGLIKVKEFAQSHTVSKQRNQNPNTQSGFEAYKFNYSVNLVLAFEALQFSMENL